MGNPRKNSQRRKFSLKDRLKSFIYAFHGMGTLLSEHNARIHLLILVFAVGAGIFFHISGSEWMAVLFVAGLVLVSECFNTAVEYLSDQISDKPSENIRKAKDVAAAGVLIAAIISVITGLIIFIPEILEHTGR